MPTSPPSPLRRLTLCGLLLMTAACGGDGGATGAAADTGVMSDATATNDAATDSAPPDTTAPQDTTSPDVAPDATATGAMAALCAQIAAATCAGWWSCCGADEEAPYPSEAACAEEVTATCVAQGQVEAAALDAGRAQLDEERVTTCLDQINEAAARCDVPGGPTLARSCGAAVVEVAQDGELCADGNSGMRCAGGGGVCFAEPGRVICKAWSPEGVACSFAPCAPELQCMMDLDPTEPAICDAPRDEGDPCRADVNCAEGLACFDNACQPQLPEGAACPYSAKCAAGLFCDDQTDTCAPQLGEGAPCSQLTTCQAGARCQGVTAEAPGVCVPAICAQGT